MHSFLISIGMIILLVTTYFITLTIYRRSGLPILVPVLTSTIILVSLLSLTNISYDTFMLGGEWLNKLLGPAIVALALPLYKQRQFIFKHAWTIIGGTLFAALIGMLSVGLLGKLFSLENDLYLATIPKSLTTPVAIDIAQLVGGNYTLTVFAVICAGISGVILAPLLFKWFHIEHSISKGISLGSASHAMGTAKAGEYNPVAFSMGSVAMTLSALIGSFMVPFVIWILH